jgi:hypothetical protein
MSFSPVSFFLMWMTLTGHDIAASMFDLNSSRVISLVWIELSLFCFASLRFAFAVLSNFQNFGFVAWQAAAPMQPSLLNSIMYVMLLREDDLFKNVGLGIERFRKGWVRWVWMPSEMNVRTLSHHNVVGRTDTRRNVMSLGDYYFHGNQLFRAALDFARHEDLKESVIQLEGGLVNRILGLFVPSFRVGEIQVTISDDVTAYFGQYWMGAGQLGILMHFYAVGGVEGWYGKQPNVALESLRAMKESENPLYNLLRKNLKC